MPWRCRPGAALAAGAADRGDLVGGPGRWWDSTSPAPSTRGSTWAPPRRGGMGGFPGLAGDEAMGLTIRAAGGYSFSTVGWPGAQYVVWAVAVVGILITCRKAAPHHRRHRGEPLPAGVLHRRRIRGHGRPGLVASLRLVSRRLAFSVADTSLVLAHRRSPGDVEATGHVEQMLLAALASTPRRCALALGPPLRAPGVRRTPWSLASQWSPTFRSCA